jgi:hypothetical protein
MKDRKKYTPVAEVFGDGGVWSVSRGGPVSHEPQLAATSRSSVWPSSVFGRNTLMGIRR